MFAILVNNSFINFWSNKPGDIFIDATIKGLRLPASQVRLIHYPDLVIPEFFEIQPNNSLIIKEKLETPQLDGSIEISYNDVEIIPGELYYENGSALKTC